VQDALRSANAQIRMLRAEVAALHEQIDCQGDEASFPLSEPCLDASAPQAAAVNGEVDQDTASAKGEVKELQVRASPLSTCKFACASRVCMHGIDDTKVLC
jgi:hypothetical protein